MTIDDVLDEYRERFVQAATDKTACLTIAQLKKTRELLPTKAHAVWLLMKEADSPEDARKMAEDFLA